MEVKANLQKTGTGSVFRKMQIHTAGPGLQLRLDYCPAGRYDFCEKNSARPGTRDILPVFRSIAEKEIRGLKNAAVRGT